MNKEQFEQMKALSQKIGKELKTPEDLAEFTQALTKMSVEAALNAELDHHLGYEKGTPKITSNSRNGYTNKTLKTEDGQFQLNTPRDREGDFEPLLVKKINK